MSYLLCIVISWKYTSVHTDELRSSVWPQTTIIETFVDNIIKDQCGNFFIGPANRIEFLTLSRWIGALPWSA